MQANELVVLAASAVAIAGLIIRALFPGRLVLTRPLQKNLIVLLGGALLGAGSMYLLADADEAGYVPRLPPAAASSEDSPARALTRYFPPLEVGTAFPDLAFTRWINGAPESAPVIVIDIWADW
jgi:hypothetical protein